METDVVFFLERFPQGVDAHDAQHAGIESIDAEMGLAGRMGCLAVVFDEFGDEAAHTAVEDDIAFRVIRRVGMHFHGCVYIVESALEDDFLFAAEEMDFTFIHEFLTVFDFDTFFARDGKEDDIAAEIVHSAGIFQCHCDAEHIGNLDEMTAAVGSACYGVS